MTRVDRSTRSSDATGQQTAPSIEQTPDCRPSAEPLAQSSSAATDANVISQGNAGAATAAAVASTAAQPPMPPARAAATRTWTFGSVMANLGAAVGRLNPSGVALRHVLAPGAYGYLPTDIHPGDDAEVRALPTVLGGQVDVRAYPPTDLARRHVAIIGFHGNGCTADSMDPFWQDLRDLGHVFAVNLPGYGASTSPANGAELELHMAAGVQAVRDHVLHELGFEPAHIVWYGLSLGGSQATIGFQMTPGSHMAVHNTFTSVTDVAGNVLKKTVGRVSGLVAAVASQSGMPRGLRRRDLDYVTDGLNTVAKLTAIRRAGTHGTLGSRLLVVGAQADALMAATYPAAIADAYYGDTHPEGALHVVPGATHNSPLDADGMQLLRTFLRRAGQ